MATRPPQPAAGSAVTPAKAGVEGRPGHDAPVVDQAADKLGRWGFARAIDRVIDSAPQGWSTRIGLYGEWGGGKTSVLKLLRTMTEARGNVVVEFSVWKASGEDGILRAFQEALQAVAVTLQTVEVPKQNRWKALWPRMTKRADFAIEATKQVGTLVGGVTGATMKGVGFALGEAGKAFSNWAKLTPKDLTVLQAALGPRKVVVFIDDLDRADPHSIPKTLLALRELLDWPNFAFVLAFDRRIVAGALSQYSTAYGESAEAFLEKIVDVPMPLPMPDGKQIAVLAGDALRTTCPFIPQEVIEQWAGLFPANPRQAKLVVRALAALQDVAERHDDDELNWHGIVGQTLLRQLAPEAAHLAEQKLIGAARTGRIATPEEVKTRHEAVLNVVLEADRATAQSEGAAAEHRRAWLQRLIGAVVLVRGGDDDQKIAYEMGLLQDEPPFTHREYRVLQRRLASDPAHIDWAAEVDAGARQSGRTVQDSAEVLVDTAIKSLVALWDDVMSADSTGNTVAAAQSYADGLNMAEALWTATLPGLHAATSKFRHCQRLLEHATYVSRRVMPEQQPLSDRAMAIVSLAAPRCDDEWAMYFAATPLRILRDETPQAIAKFLVRIRQSVEPSMLSIVMNAFRQSGGVPALLADQRRGPDNALWVLACPQSPLFAAGKANLIALFNNAQEGSEGADANVIRNAFEHLSVIGMISVSSGWITDYSVFAADHGDLVSVAWQAALRVDGRGHRRHGLPTLRNSLIERGIPDSLLVAPAWFPQILKVEAGEHAAVPLPGPAALTDGAGRGASTAAVDDVVG